MALSDDDKKELIELFSDAVAGGLEKFRSKAEEDAAKNNQGGGGGNDGNTGGTDNKSKWSWSGFLLGDK